MQNRGACPESILVKIQKVVKLSSDYVGIQLLHSLGFLGFGFDGLNDLLFG